jgi:hypothetical protein
MEISDFTALKAKIENAKTKRARAEGAMAEGLKRLKSEFQCDSLEDADKKLDALQKEIDADEVKLADMLKEIEGAINWNEL